MTKEIAMDLGTANTVIIHNDKVVVDEPSIVAIDRTTNKIMAVGKKAMMMHGKTHENIKTIRPLRDGVIADFMIAEHMMRELIKMINTRKPLFPPSLKMVISIPSGITEVEERAVKDSAEQAGANGRGIGAGVHAQGRAVDDDAGACNRPPESLCGHGNRYGRDRRGGRDVGADAAVGAEARVERR